MSRYTRDEIISQGLDLAHSPTVTTHDAPGGIIQQNAWSIKWLQNALDFFHRKYPFASDILDVSITIQANSVDAVLTSNTSLFLPLDFVLDVRDGIDVFDQNGRFYPIYRRDYRTWRVLNQTSQGFSGTRANIYTILNNRIKVLPLLSESRVATLHYYALPPVLKNDDVPSFPDEWVLVEFVRLKCLEWVRSLEPGTAHMYLTRQLAGLRASGLLHEPENESGIPVYNNQTILDGEADRNAWMGNIGV
jgi:hypothetical protein